MRTEDQFSSGRKRIINDSSWVVVVVFVTLFGGIRACSSWLEKDTQRKFNEIIEKSGGTEQFLKKIDDSTISKHLPEPATSTLMDGFDEENSTFKSSVYHIIWDLREDGLEWVERPIIGESTIFKVRDYNKNILISININEYDDDGTDAWDLISLVDNPQMERLRKSSAELQGLSVLSSQTTKVMVSSKRALLTRTDQLGSNGYWIAYSYVIPNHGILYNIAITSVDIASEDISDYETSVKHLIKGISIW